jgi:LPXTG-motif cell wall-anchored protein
MGQDKTHSLLPLLAGLAVCCGIKLLILSGGLGFLASIWIDDGWWFVSAGGILLLTGAGWWLRRRRRPGCSHPCNSEVQGPIPSVGSDLNSKTLMN